MKICRNFTLLEVIIALLILSLGIFFLLSELVLAQNRVKDTQQQWEQMHEMVNAAEYLLLNGCDADIDAKFLTPEKYHVKFSAEKAELPVEMNHPAGGKTLFQMKIRLCDLQNKELDTLRVEFFREATAADVKEK